MIREIALDMFRGNFPFPPNFHLLLICVGESAALSTTSVRVTAVSRCLLQKARKQRLLRQPLMAISSRLRWRPHKSATNTDTMNSREGKSMTYRTGGEGGILAQSLRPSCHLFSNMHEKRLNTADFSDFYYFNSTKIFSCLVLIFALNRHQRHQGSDRASRTLIRTL